MAKWFVHDAIHGEWSKVSVFCCWKKAITGFFIIYILVENEEHCDFVKLREAMLRMNVDALRERTHTVLYEKYRRERLREMGVRDGDTGPKMVEASKQVAIKNRNE